MTPAGFLLAFFALLAIGFPIFLVLGLTSGLAFTMDGRPLVAAAQKIVDELNSATLSSVPFFVIAAKLMERGGVSRALVDAASSWVGSIPGGLALVCVVTCTVFAAISGSSVATALAMAVILVPAMTAKGYDRRMALGVVGASGTLGILIPPSLPMIVYGVVADASVPRLFLAGLVPGLIQALLFGGWIVWRARRGGYPREAPLGRAEFVRRNLRALPALSIPAIVLGGIYGGIVTVTEAAALSAFAALIATLFFYREATLAEIPSVLTEAIKTTATIMIIVAMAFVFSHWITESGTARRIVDAIVALDLNKWVFLLIVNVLLILLGMFLEVFAIILIVLPLVLPIMAQLGIDPVHFAVVMTVNMEIGLLTPPIGLNLFVLASSARVPVSEVAHGVLPFIAILVALLAAITYIPALSLWLPNLVYG